MSFIAKKGILFYLLTLIVAVFGISWLTVSFINKFFGFKFDSSECWLLLMILALKYYHLKINFELKYRIKNKTKQTFTWSIDVSSWTRLSVCLQWVFKSRRCLELEPFYSTVYIVCMKCLLFKKFSERIFSFLFSNWF